MGGEGSIAGMIISLRNNKALLGKKRKAFKDLPVSHDSKKPLVYDSKMSEEELQQFSKKLKREKLVRDLVWVVVIFIALAITGYITMRILGI